MYDIDITVKSIITRKRADLDTGDIAQLNCIKILLILTNCCCKRFT